MTTKATAQDIMTKEPICAELTMTIRQLAQLLEENGISGCPVVNAEGKVVGVVSKTDLIRRCMEGTSQTGPGRLFDEMGELPDEEDEAGIDPMGCVEDFMTDEVATVSPSTPVTKVATIMVDRRIHRIVVVDEEGFPEGIITSLDLLGLFPGIGEIKKPKRPAAGGKRR